MRIISGKLKARRFSIPKNFPSRPTTDFAKEGLFNMLNNMFTLDELEIADLCSGTGNITLEFLSREAGKVTAVDQNALCLKHLLKLAKDFEVDQDLNVIKEDILTFLEKTPQKFDLIFTDPPYDFKGYQTLIKLVFERKILNEGGILIVEHSKFTQLFEEKYFFNERVFGNVVFTFFEYGEKE